MGISFVLGSLARKRLQTFKLKRKFILIKLLLSISDSRRTANEQLQLMGGQPEEARTPSDIPTRSLALSAEFAADPTNLGNLYTNHIHSRSIASN